MARDLRRLEFGVDYRSGPLGWSDLQADGSFFVAAYQEVLQFTEDGLVSRRFHVLENSRALGRADLSQLHRSGVAKYSFNRRGAIEFEFSDAKYIGLPRRAPNELPTVEVYDLLMFHVSDKASGLSRGLVVRTEAEDPGDAAFEQLCRSIDVTDGVAELRRYLAGGDVNARHPADGQSLLHLACEHGNLELIRALAENGADLDARDHFGHAPLHVAVDIDIDGATQSGAEMTFETTRLLLSLGADPHAKDGRGRTVRDVAAVYGDGMLAQFDRLTGHGA